MTANTAGSSGIAPWLLAAGIVAFLAGIGVAFAIGGPSGESDASLTPPCEAGYSEHPDGICVPDTQVCHAWLDGASSQAVECTVTSPDGDGDVVVDLEGQGRASVVVTDEDGDTVMDATSQIPWMDTFELPGEPGTWRLQVRFSDAVGQGTVTLWG